MKCVFFPTTTYPYLWTYLSDFIINKFVAWQYYISYLSVNITAVNYTLMPLFLDLMYHLNNANIYFVIAAFIKDCYKYIKAAYIQIYTIGLFDLLRLFSLLIHPPMMISWWWEAACTLPQTLLNKPDLQINSFKYLRLDYMIPVIFMILAFSLNFNFGQNISHNVFINILPPNWY